MLRGHRKAHRPLTARSLDASTRRARRVSCRRSAPTPLHSNGRYSIDGEASRPSSSFAIDQDRRSCARRHRALSIHGIRSQRSTVVVSARPRNRRTPTAPGVPARALSTCTQCRPPAVPPHAPVQQLGPTVDRRVSAQVIVMDGQVTMTVVDVVVTFTPEPMERGGVRPRRGMPAQVTPRGPRRGLGCRHGWRRP